MGQRGQRALLICTSPGIGGTERVVLGLTRGLHARGVNTETFFPEAVEETSAQFLADEMGVQINISNCVRNFRLARRPRDVLALWRLVRSIKPQLVNVHFGNNRISIWDTLAIRLAGVRRCIASIHHAVPFQSRRAGIQTMLASRLCSQVVVTTPVLTKILTDAGVQAKKIIEIPLGVAAPSTPQIDPRQARKNFGIPEDSIVIASLGRLVSSKGFEDLITAVSLIDSGARPVHLLIGGEGPMEEHLRSLAQELLGERAHMLGRIDDPVILYAACDVFSLASHEEGFGLVFIEAALHRVPSVAANVGGVSYAIIHGRTGLLVPDRDPPSLASAISVLLHDDKLRKRMGAAAHERAMHEFSETRMTERYYEVFFPPESSKDWFDARSFRAQGHLKGKERR